MQRIFLSALAVPVAMLAASCAPQTPASRIAARPGVYERLGETDKRLVRDGEIAEGMGQDAVALAWGKPSAEVEGLRGGERTERWDYYAPTPVFRDGFFGGYGSGSYAGYNYSGVGVGFAPEVIYLPSRKGSVWFVGGRVEEWERVR